VKIDDPLKGWGAALWPPDDDARLVHRVAHLVWPLLQQTAAAVIAWLIASKVVSHPEPFFAPIAALVGLNATLGRRGSNAVRLLVGVGVGIVVGELAVALIGAGAGSLAVATFTAMVIARLLDGQRIVIAQAGVSAILITALGDPAEGAHRLIDAVIGAGVALTFSQLFFSPEPLRLLRRAEAGVLAGLADALRLLADALDRDDEELAEQALSRLRGLRDRLSDLSTVRKASNRIVRHSATWRSRRAPVVQETESADQLDLLAGSCLMLARTSMATTAEQRPSLVSGVRMLGQSLTDLAGLPGDRATRQRAAQRALDLAHRVIEHGEDVPALSPMAGACAAVRMVAIDVMVFAGVEPGLAVGAVRLTGEDVQVPEPLSDPRKPWLHRPAWLRRPRRPAWLQRLLRRPRDHADRTG
jgi:uncharacterized membrane protein YgaE (UPF0421/DUF939 family)